LCACVIAIAAFSRDARAQTGIAFVQVNSATPQSASTTVSVTYTSSQAAGNLNVVVVGWNDASAHVQSVTDTSGNAYVMAVGPTVHTSVATQSIYYAQNIAASAAGANTVSVGFDRGAAYADVRVAEYRGLDTIAPLDVTAAATGSGTSTDSGAATTTSANDLIVGANLVLTHSTGPGAGFTSRVITRPDGDILEDRIVTSAGSYRATAPITPSAQWIMQMVAFKAAGSGSGSDSIAPSTPVDLSVNAVSSSQINLSWAASTDNVGVAGYRVLRNGAEIETSTQTSYNDSGLSPSTTYTYTVTAFDAASNVSSQSQGLTVTTSAAASTPIAFVQLKEARLTSSANSISTGAFVSAVGGGHLMVVWVWYNTASQNVTSVTDTAGNTYARAVGPTTGTGPMASWRQELWYAKNLAGASGVTVTAMFSGTFSAEKSITAHEYSGADTASPLDATAAAAVSGSNVSSGETTTTSPNELVFGAVLLQASGSAGSGFTRRSSIASNVSEDKPVATAGPYSATFTNSLQSAIVQMATFKAAGAGQPDLEAPTAPGTLVATAVSASQINLNWTASTDNVGVTGYRLERCQSAGCATFSEIAAPSGTATVFSDTAVSVGATYGYRVRAADAAGNLGPYSNTSSATVPAPDTQAPTAPGLLTATAPNGTHVNLSWGAATDNVAVMDYRVERCPGVCATTGFVKIGTVAGTTFSDSGLTPNTTYSYIVSAEDTSSNLGPYSNVSNVTTLATIPELVAAYAFDEGTGTAVADASGNNRTGTIANATWASNGKFGKGLSFNGTNATVRIPDDPGLHLSTAMTLEAWVNPSAVTSAWRDVIYKGNDNYFLMGTTSQSGRPSVGGIFGTANVNNYGLSTLALNTWSHLAGTYDGTTLRLYVNGTQVASTPRTGLIASSTNPLEIGGDSIFGQYFTGLIDEVRVYNVALSPAQIQLDMAAPISVSSPVAALSPASLGFGSQGTGTASAGQNVIVTNTGTAPLVISSVSLTGTNATDFAQTSTCITTLAPGAACAVTVTFTPAAIGSRTATLAVADNAAGSPQIVPLSGTGTGFSIAPRVSVLTPTLNQQFGVSGGGNLTWSVDGVVGGDGTKGTITQGGLYTPPSDAGTHTVSVTTDQWQTSSATVYVTTYAGTFTHHNDNLRTGQNLNETVLKPANVNSGTFGKLFSYPLDGLSIASPLYVAGVTMPGQGVHNVVYVATEHDSVYAFDADGISASPLWQRSFLSAGVTPVPASDTGECCDLAPEIGVTGTPVIDRSTNTLYVVAKTKEGPNTYVQRLHALDLGSGAEKFGGPVVIQARVPGTGNGASGGHVEFDPLRQNQRPSLLLNNGVVFVGFGSHGDQQPYHGWLLGYDAGTLQPVMTLNVSPNADGGGIWQANGGPAADAAGNIYVITGNGAFDANTGGSDFGDSFLKVTPSGTIADYFTPWNQGALNANNFDLGAAGPLLLPDQPGAHPHLMVSAGKNNTICLVDRDAMGHYSGTTSDNQIVQSLINIFPFGTPEPGNYSAPVYFNGTVYFGPIADSIQAFPLTNGLLRTTALTRSADVFKYPGATLAISAAGTSDGILWAIQRNGDCGVQPSCGTAAPGVLKAYDASNLGTLLYSSDQMAARDMFDFATKFSVPLVANGKVFVGSLGQLTVYGLLP
jgi:chitodextrinase